jgi:hypothetical protein
MKWCGVVAHQKAMPFRSECSRSGKTFCRSESTDYRNEAVQRQWSTLGRWWGNSKSERLSQATRFVNMNSLSLYGYFK